MSLVLEANPDFIKSGPKLETKEIVFMCAKKTIDSEGRTLVYQGDGTMSEKRHLEALERLDRMMHHSYEADMELESLRLRLGISGSAETLVVVTALDAEGTRFVGFHSSYNVLDAFAGAIDRVYHGKIRWREDDYQPGSGQK